MAQPVLLFQKTQVWVPAPMVPGSVSPPGLHGDPHMGHIHIKINVPRNKTTKGTFKKYKNLSKTKKATLLKVFLV